MAELPSSSRGWRRLMRQVAARAQRWDGKGAAYPDPSDLVHSAYLRFLESPRPIEVENPVAFVVKSAINLGINQRKRAEVSLRSSVSPEDLSLQDGAPLQDEVLIARERLERVTEGLVRMSPRTREVFLMHRLDGLKYREIANQLGISQSAVEKHIAKAAEFLSRWCSGW